MPARFIPVTLGGGVFSPLAELSPTPTSTSTYARGPSGRYSLRGGRGLPTTVALPPRGDALRFIEERHGEFASWHQWCVLTRLAEAKPAGEGRGQLPHVAPITLHMIAACEGDGSSLMGPTGNHDVVENRLPIHSEAVPETT